MTASLLDLSIVDAMDLMKRKELSPVDLTQAYLDNISKYNEDINAYITVTSEIALQQAKAAEARYAAGDSGLLDGIPIGVKDLYCTKGVRTTAASKMLENFVPEYESFVTELLFRNGGVMLGKTNMDEFAMGGANRFSYFGKTINPLRSKGRPEQDLIPGGSSGGSAAAVRGKMALGALGSDTGGSIRQPASCCGIVGIKPTYGRCSRRGVIAFASSLDCPGVFANNIQDAALLLEGIAGYDRLDSTSYDAPIPEMSKGLRLELRGVKVGFVKEFYESENISAAARASWDAGLNAMKELGAEIIDISIPNIDVAIETYYVIAPAEAASNLARYDGIRYGYRYNKEEVPIEELYVRSRSEGFGEEVKRRILLGNYILAAGHYDVYYTRARKVMYKIAQGFTEAFRSVDIVSMPVTQSSAYSFNDEVSVIDEYLNDVYTVCANLAGLPAVSLPVFLDEDHLPVNIQLLGKHNQEDIILNAGHAIEKHIDFKL